MWSPGNRTRLAQTQDRREQNEAGEHHHGSQDRLRVTLSLLCLTDSEELQTRRKNGDHTVQLLHFLGRQLRTRETHELFKVTQLIYW